MSEHEPKGTIGAGAWIAIIVGGILILALCLGCVAFLFFGVRTSSSVLTTVPASVPASAPAAPTAPAAPATQPPPSDGK